jgi:hypothetical protein
MIIEYQNQPRIKPRRGDIFSLQKGFEMENPGLWCHRNYLTSRKPMLAVSTILQEEQK